MKTKKYHLMLATVITILFISAVGNTDLPAPVKQRVIGEPPFERGLIGQANPALSGIEELYVIIQQPDSEPNKDGLVFEELQEKIKKQLEIAGLKITKDDVPEKLKMILKKRSEKYGIKHDNLKFRSGNIPEFRVDIDMLKLDDLQQYVFHIQTSLAAKVYLPRGRSWSLKADVWKALPTMQAISVRNMPGKVTELVLKHVEAFIYAYQVANYQVAHTPDADSPQKGIRKDDPKPPPRLLATKFNYVASKNSKVFHIPTCSSAARIAPKNLVGYSTRTDAIRAGKRPCKICKP